MLTCIIIENEPDVSHSLCKKLKEFATLRLLAKFSNLVEACTAFRGIPPVDLLIVATTIPQECLIDQVYLLRAKAKKLLCTTEAEISLQAYLIDIDGVLNRDDSENELKFKLSKLCFENLVISGDRKPDYFFIKDKDKGNQTTKIRFTDIIAVESQHNYVGFYTTKGQFTAYLRLSDVMTLLSRYNQFMRVHRCFIISKDYILHLDGLDLVMEGNLRLRIGASYSKSFLDFIRYNTVALGYNSSKSGSDSKDSQVVALPVGNR